MLVYFEGCMSYVIGFVAYFLRIYDVVFVSEGFILKNFIDYPYMFTLYLSTKSVCIIYLSYHMQHSKLPRFHFEMNN